MLPPTRGAFLPHILRANYVTMRDKSYTATCPVLPPIEQCGWVLENGVNIPVQSLNLPAPKAVIELVKCACKKGCSKNCSCVKNKLPCTPLCKCYNTLCNNKHTVNDVRLDQVVDNEDNSDDDDDDDDDDFDYDEVYDVFD